MSRLSVANQIRIRARPANAQAAQTIPACARAAGEESRSTGDQKMRKLFRAHWILVFALGALLAGGASASGGTRGDRLLARLADQVVNGPDTTCFERSHLSTTNARTPPGH